MELDAYSVLGSLSMPHYRIFTLTKQGHVATPPVIVECRDDEAAEAEARRLLDGADVEVWLEKRLVVRLSAKRR
jgi:hypothetical protein